MNGHIDFGRSTGTEVREQIALIRGGSGTIVGTAKLVDCRGPLTLEQLAGHEDKHAVPPPVLDEVVSL